MSASLKQWSTSSTRNCRRVWDYPGHLIGRNSRPGIIKGLLNPRFHHLEHIGDYIVFERLERKQAERMKAAASWRLSCVRPLAEADLDQIDDLIAEDSPQRAIAIVRRIRKDRGC